LQNYLRPIGTRKKIQLFQSFKKSQPLPSGILSGLGEGLAKDDYGDVKDWFTFKKKDTSAEPSTTTESTHTAADDLKEKR
jgi:hypothetical protein